MSTNNDLFTGIYPALLTPINADYSCNIDELADHAKNLMSLGCNGIVVFGTTGEGASFTVGEKIRVLKGLVDRNIPVDRIIVGVGCSSIEDAVELSNASLLYNCSSVLMHPSYYFKNVSDAGVIEFYKQVIERVNNKNFKVFLYHIPQFTGVPITFNVIKALKESFPDTIIGLKDSEGKYEYTESLIKAFPELKVFCGSDVYISQAVRAGAVGAVSGVSNICPKIFLAAYENGKDASKPNKDKEAKDLCDVVCRHNFLASTKAILESKRGPAWALLRPPLAQLSAEIKESLIKEFQSLNLE